MPEKIIASVRKSVKKAHPGYSGKRVDAEVYATMNKQGYMHGSKETSKGEAAERKFSVDHSEG